jgi:uncharacterized membrane protein YebE (DUF533 family)
MHTIPEWQVCTAYRYQGEQEDLSRYFEQENRRPERLTKIKAQRPADLAHQELLTQQLWSCIPEYQTFSECCSEERRETAYLSLLAEQLSVPIAIVSHGPTATDKQMMAIMR